jgi:hypothetical protein
MEADRGLGKAFGFLGVGIVAFAAGAFALVAFGVDHPDVLPLFLPLVVAYSAVVAVLSLGIALYVFVSARIAGRD